MVAASSSIGKAHHANELYTGSLLAGLRERSAGEPPSTILLGTRVNEIGLPLLRNRMQRRSTLPKDSNGSLGPSAGIGRRKPLSTGEESADDEIPFLGKPITPPSVRGRRPRPRVPSAPPSHTPAMAPFRAGRADLLGHERGAGRDRVLSFALEPSRASRSPRPTHPSRSDG